jgi:hypothetical protein
MEAKDKFDYAWKYFSQHADQRISLMNYFVILSTVLTTGLSSTYADRLQSTYADRLQNHIVGAILGFLLLLISVIFYKLDARNKFLTKRGEAALKELEKLYLRDPASPNKPSVLEIVSREEVDTQELKIEEKGKGQLFRQASYSDLVHVLFVIYGILGVIGFVSSLVLWTVSVSLK